MTTHQVGSYGPPVSTDDPTATPQPRASAPEQNQVPEYEIRVAGRVASRWASWFDDLTIDTVAGGITVIRGHVVDQSALHGLIQKLRDAGIPLISLTQVASTTPTEPPAHPTPKEN